MKLRAVILGDTSYHDWLRTALGDDVELLVLPAGRAEEVIEQFAQLGSVQLLFAQFDRTQLGERAALVERLAERAADLTVVALGNGDEPDVMLGAMRAGVRDFLVPGRDDAAVAGLVERALRRSGGRAQNRGRVTVVMSAYADTGTAFLAEHLALAGVESLPRNEPVLLIDLGMPAGASLVFLNQQQQYSILEAIQDAYRCDQTLVDTAFTRHGSNLHVLSLPESLIGVPAIDSEELGRFIDVVRGLFAWVVIALDASLGIPTVRVLVERSTQTLVVCEQSIISSRAGQHLLQGLRQAGALPDRVGLVVDRYQKRLALVPAKLAESCQLPLLATLPGDVHARNQAMNAGEALYRVAPRDDYSQAVKRLAHQLMERRMPTAEPAEQGGLFSRLLR